MNSLVLMVKVFFIAGPRVCPKKSASDMNVFMRNDACSQVFLQALFESSALSSALRTDFLQLTGYRLFHPRYLTFAGFHEVFAERTLTIPEISGPMFSV
ncbi:hypothetical protein [Burkholderia sp. Ac-20365]|uniref:hypothetical protein n=1 Tax=Burkholderia sp. Ac-20365 TaxID=2703897 RepID=UPI00197B9CE0|nr:hypothetical protein [Burkholderia sp. Ac-20365]MBN3764400.1 hypothetical protein [Burkholderia sp. Ac-20365]